MTDRPYSTLLDRLARPAVDRWLPPPDPTRDPGDVLRMRIVSTLLQALAGLAVLFGVFDIASGLYPLAFTLFGGLPIAMLALRRMRNGAPMIELAVTAPATLFLVLVANASLNGGLEAPALVFLPLVPALALLVDARRLAVAWVGVCAVTVVITFVLESPLETPFLQTMPADMVALNLMLVLVAMSVMVFGAFFLNMEFGVWMQSRLVAAEAERLDQILDAAGDAIVRVEGTGRVSTANAAAVQLFGVGPLAGRLMKSLIPDLDQLWGAQGAVMLQATHVDGSIPIEATQTALGAGQVLVIRDIRERLAAQAQIEQARDEAQAASAAKSRFLASMSHELRTPLNAVIGYSEMLAEEIEAGIPPTDVRDLNHIAGSARHLLALIDQVLDLAKVEAGRMEVEYRTVPLRPFLDELATIGHTLSRNEDNRWVADLPETSATIPLDELRVRQIVLNLLSNAAKFCKKGEIRFEASLSEHNLTLRVADTGIGMDGAVLEAVWEDFGQGSLSTARHYGGTGLGLPLSKRLAELLGGALDVQSTPGEGTVFTAVIPLGPSPS
jgi:signal transduction histidine kinase